MSDPKTPEQPRRSVRGNVRRADDDEDVRGAALDLRAGLVQMRDNAQETLAICRREQIAMQEARAAFNARGSARGGPVKQTSQRDGEPVALVEDSKAAKSGEGAGGVKDRDDVQHAEATRPDHNHQIIQRRADCPTTDQLNAMETPADDVQPAVPDQSRDQTTNIPDTLQLRVDKFVASIDWLAVATSASKSRGGILCQVEETFVVGRYNLVKVVTFSDHVRWVVRLRAPSCASGFDHREALAVERGMRVEIATTKFLRERTSLPIPEIFAYDLDPNNAVGAPYMFMPLINGTPADELAETRGFECGTFGTPAQNERFWQRVAEIHVELANIQLDLIGSLYEDGDGFTIGPEIETMRGPWNTAGAYYADLANLALGVANKDASPEQQSFDMPSIFSQLMRQHGKPGQRGPFSLVHRDLRPHHLLVDDNFEIVGVIDFEAVMAAPVEVVAQLPAHMGMRPPPLGVDVTPQAAMEKETLLAGKYAALFEEAAERKGGAGAIEVGDWFLSDAAGVVHGLKHHGGHQLLDNEKWWEAYMWFKHAWLVGGLKSRADDRQDAEMRD